MFKRIFYILAAGLLNIWVGLPGPVLAEEGAVIVSVSGSGAPDTVLSSPSADITPFLTIYGFDRENKPFFRRVSRFTEDAKPIFENDDNDDEAGNQCPHCKH